MVSLGTVEFAKKFLAGHTLRRVRQGDDWVIVIDVVIRNQIIDFLKSTNSLSFPLGFFCANIGLAYFENGSVVIIPYLWSYASSTNMFSLRLTGVGRL